MDRFKDCPNPKCKGRQSMIVSIRGWLCILCFLLIPFEKGEEVNHNV
jgi:hypothetical protein